MDVFTACFGKAYPIASAPKVKFPIIQTKTPPTGTGGGVLTTQSRDWAAWSGRLNHLHANLLHRILLKLPDSLRRHAVFVC